MTKKLGDLDTLIKFVSKKDRLIRYFENKKRIKNNRIAFLVDKAKNNDFEALKELEAIRISDLLSYLKKQQFNFF